MDQKDIRKLLEQVKSGALSTEEAVEKLKIAPFEDLGYAKVDHHRGVRQGTPEVIFGSGKTSGQIIGIARSMQERGESNILITRLSTDAASDVSGSLDLTYDPVSRIGLVGKKCVITASGTIVVATGGTSDIPVAEEAAQVAEALGNHVERVYDVGVAGLHRLLSKLDILMRAQVVIAVAGMEGALGKRCRRPCGLPCDRRSHEASATGPTSAACPLSCPCSTPAPAGSASSTSTTVLAQAISLA